MKYDPLIFGKSQIERVVAIEVEGDTVDIFIEDKDGAVRNEWMYNSYWLLSQHALGSDWKRLKGDLHYKWGKKYSSYEDFKNDRNRYRNKADTYSISDTKEAALVINGITYFKGMKVSDVSTLAFDIETTGLVHDETSKVLLISNTFRKQGTIQRKLFCYDDYPDQSALLAAWCEWVRSVDPSVILGHNIFGYDLPYLQYIAEREQITLDLGRDTSALRFDSWESKFRVDGSKDLHYHRAHIYGRNIIDTLFVSYKYDIGRKYENYKLKYIVAFEKLEVDGRQFYDGEKIRDNYTIPEEWIKIKKYAEHDADDALALYDLMIPAYFYLTPSIPKTFQQMLYTASGSQINSFLVRSYLQQGHSVAKATETNAFEGAISFGNPGIFKNVMKVDVSSLYPSIMLTYNVYDKFKDPNQNFIKMVRYFTDERLKNKKTAKETGDSYYTDLEQAQKIIINSAYGMMGSTGLNYNSPINAAFVTRKGREILTQSIQWAEKNNLFVVNGDTDSISFNKKNQSYITKDEQKCYLQELNSNFPKTISWEHDGYFETVCVIKAKNYILKPEGKPVKVKGSALKATTKEPALKKFINEVIDCLVTDKTDHIINLYHGYVKDIFQVRDITAWCSKKTITDKVINAERTNEQRVLDAIEDSEYQEGDKVYMYFNTEGNLKLRENWSNDHDPIVLLKKLYNTVLTFQNVLDMEQFKNYSLVKYQNVAREMAGIAPVIKTRKPRSVEVSQ